MDGYDGLSATLFAWSFDRSSGFGAARYASNLSDGLEALGMRIKRADCAGYPSVPWDPSWRTTAHFSTRALHGCASGGICHLTMDRPSYAIPVLRRVFGAKVAVSILDTRLNLPRDESVRMIRSGSLRRAVKDADLLVAISSSIARDLVDSFDADPSSIVTIPMGVDRRFHADPAWRAGKPFTVGYLGRFERHNDLPFLMKGFSLARSEPGPPMRLMLYGVGPCQEECIALAKEAGGQGIHFMGFAPEARIVEIYNSFDAFVFPSRVEGFGMPIIEAQRCGIPVIVRSDAHIPPEVSRFCLKADDEGHLAQLLLEIREKGWASPPGLDEHLGGFTWESISRRTADAYLRM